jgi:UDP-N-acetylglucosamine--dolichyl-phosphate N-acetylglucosaminephosphotransferase
MPIPDSGAYTLPSHSPESLGLVCASIYIILLILFIPFPFSATFFNRQAQQGQTKHGLVVDDFPHHQVNFTSCTIMLLLTHHQLSVYLSSLLSILMATMLGFLDDVFDIRWRHKLPIPIIASIPLLMVYFAEQGSTNVVVPVPLRPFLGALLNLGSC